jgi:hypothetical protein
MAPCSPTGVHEVMPEGIYAAIVSTLPTKGNWNTITLIGIRESVVIQPLINLIHLREAM